MEKNFFVTKVSSLQLESTMVLINDKGQERRGAAPGSSLQPNVIDSKLVVRFDTPADIKGTSFCRWNTSTATTTCGLPLPALKKSRRLASNKKDSFVGSDFSYADITLPKVTSIATRLLRTEKVDGADCYVVESVPANDGVRANYGYGRKLTRARRQLSSRARSSITTRRTLVEDADGVAPRAGGAAEGAVVRVAARDDQPTRTATARC
jgi:hypothetical protein